MTETRKGQPHKYPLNLRIADSIENVFYKMYAFVDEHATKLWAAFAAIIFITVIIVIILASTTGKVGEFNWQVTIALFLLALLSCVLSWIVGSFLVFFIGLFLCSIAYIFKHPLSALKRVMITIIAAAAIFAVLYFCPPAVLEYIIYITPIALVIASFIQLYNRDKKQNKQDKN